MKGTINFRWRRKSSKNFNFYVHMRARLKWQCFNSYTHMREITFNWNLFSWTQLSLSVCATFPSQFVCVSRWFLFISLWSVCLPFSLKRKPLLKTFRIHIKNVSGIIIKSQARKILFFIKCIKSRAVSSTSRTKFNLSSGFNWNKSPHSPWH